MMIRYRRPLFIRALIALLIISIVAVSHYEIDSWFGDNTSFLPFTLAILVVVLWIGPGPAIPATFLALILGIAFAGRYSSSSMETAFAAATFAALSGGIIFLAHRINRSIRSAARQARRANENHLRSILSTVPDAMIVIDEDDRIYSFSTTAEMLFGYAQSDVMDRPTSILMPAPDSEHHAGHLLHYGPAPDHPENTPRTLLMQHKDGTLIPVEVSVGEAIGGDGRRIFTCFIRDLTERRQTEEKLAALQGELIHVSRVGAMGAMASTLAHELNQPITAVVNYVEGVRDILNRRHSAPADMPVVLDALDNAAKEALRAGSILRHLRDFVARGEVEKTVESLAPLIHEAVDFGLMGTHDRAIEARYDITPNSGPVLIDKVQIQQVLINIVRNGIEAMGDCRDRHFSVSARPDPHPSFVRISIADNGPGIAPEIMPQLFNAFVSTKTQGMGLGLSICRTIIEANGGRIWAEPRAGGGTIFHFTLVRATLDGAGDKEGQAERKI